MYCLLLQSDVTYKRAVGVSVVVKGLQPRSLHQILRVLKDAIRVACHTRGVGT